MRRRRRALLVVPLCISVLAACSGGSNGATKQNAVADAKAACQVFQGLKPPTGSSQTAQSDYAKASYLGFLKATDLANKAAILDTRWNSLESAAQQEAAAFEVIAKAADPHSSGDVTAAAVKNAVSASTAARPEFIAQCQLADPGFLNQPSATSSPTATAN